MNIQKIDGTFSICKVTDYSQVNLDSEYCFLAKTDEERSLVCLTGDVPKNATACDHGWNAFRIQGVLDFSLVGILAKLSGLLADSRIGIFAVSTYNTDYILTRQADYDRALKVLSEAGYCVLDLTPPASDI